ncbi:recombination regulator RecX [Methylobacillus sp. MM3]|uniref:recombination regulator RecX n=1 Tax=Methylobacillus sp. MM3 TaxID=1848039 RepID=UPI0007DF6B06|nr:recombination regulator RecX [Methylobacillus sp. MM3]OAJ70148.1 recombination regulator RecX [Methylobacillus sp. MM3]
MRKATPSLRERALGYLTRREYSRQELHRKLLPYAGEEDLDGLLDEFSKRGWISDARYVDQMVHARKGKYGSLKVAHELRAQGVAEELVDKAVTEVRKEELETARNLWRKKFGAQPDSREEWAKQARFLQSRGFGMDTIKAVLRGEPDDE